MPRILVTAGFKFAVDGNQVIEVEPGEQDVSERCAEVAVDHLKVASRLPGAVPVVVASEPVAAGAVVVVVNGEPPAAMLPPAAAKPAAKSAAKPAAKPSTKPAPKANAGGK
jgi:septal ring-binding cell division protein DamX